MIELVFGVMAWLSLGTMAAIAVGRASAIGTRPNRCAVRSRRRG